MPDRSYALNIVADISRYQKEFAKIEGFTDKKAAAAALKMVNQMQRAQAQAAKDAKKAADKSAKAWSGAFSGVTLAITPADIKRMGTAAIDLAQDVADLRNELTDTSTRTGIATDTLQGLRLAAEGSGQEFTSLISGLAQFPKRLTDFERGTGEAENGLEALGFTADDAGMLIADTDAAMKEILIRLKGVEDPARQAAIATEIFGKSGSKMLQALSGTELETYVKFAKEFGVDVGQDAADSASEWQRSQAELNTTLDASKAKLIDTFNVDELLSAFTLGMVFVGELTTSMISGMIDDFTAGKNALSALFSGDLDEAKALALGIDGIAGGTTKAGIAAVDAAKSFFDLRREMRKTGDEVVRVDAATKKVTRGRKEASDGVKEQADALKSLQTITEQATQSQLSDEDKIRVTLFKRLELIDETAKAADDEAAAQAARVAVYEESQAGLLALDEARAAQVESLAAKSANILARETDDRRSAIEEINVAEQEALESHAAITAQRMDMFVEDQAVRAEILAEAEEQRTALVEEFAKRRADAEEESADVAIDKQREIRDASISAFSSLASAVADASMTAAQAQTDATGRGAMLLYGLAKTAAISKIGLQTAEGISMAAAFPPPASIALGVAVGIANAAALAVVASTAPPQFGDTPGAILAGTSGLTAKFEPGDFVVAAKTKEGVADQAAALGGGGGGRSTMMVYKHKVFDYFMQDHLRQNSFLTRTIRSGSRVGHRQRKGA